MNKIKIWKAMLLFWVLPFLSSCIVSHPSGSFSATGGALHEENIRVEGRTRHYLAYIPQSLPPHSSLLFVLHGSLGSPQQMRTLTAYRFEQLADRYHFIVVYPEGFERHWNDCRKEGHYAAKLQHIDDITFLRNIRDHFYQHYDINPKQVYAMGYSNGGQLAYRLALEAPDLVSRIAVVSANLPTSDNFDCRIVGKPVSTLILNGTADPINPYRGGNVTLFGFSSRGNVRSTIDSAKWFATLNKATLQPSEVNTTHSSFFWVEKIYWKSSSGNEVLMYGIHGGGHTLPQPYVIYPLFLGWTYSGMDGPLEIWRFLNRQNIH